MLEWVGQCLMKDFQASMSKTKSLLTLLSFRSLLITLFHVLLGRPLGKLTLMLKVLYLLHKAFSFTLFRWPNHCNHLSCKDSFMLFNFSLVLSSSAEILSSGLKIAHWQGAQLQFRENYGGIWVFHGSSYGHFMYTF